MYLMTTDDGYCESNEVFLYDGVMDERTAREIVANMDGSQCTYVEIRKLKSRTIGIPGDSGNIEIVTSSTEHFDSSFEVLRFSIDEK